jgi:hypothetical protein
MMAFLIRVKSTFIKLLVAEPIRLHYYPWGTIFVLLRNSRVFIEASEHHNAFAKSSQNGCLGAEIRNPLGVLFNICS